MRKKSISMVLCLLFVVQLVCSSAAAKTVYFTGVEESVLPLSDSTMPFWSNSYLYIPTTIFTGAVRDALNVGYAVASDGSWVALYQDSKALLFKEDYAYGEDGGGNIYYPGTIKRNGTFFVPASVVAEYFGLKYSVIKVERGHLVWLRSSKFVLSDSQFADAASGVMKQRYADYTALKTPKPVQPQPEMQVHPQIPTVQEPEIVSGKKIYLCGTATENLEPLLAILDRYSAKATIFCPPEWMAENHDLLRRMVGTGYGIGILADGEDDQSVLEQLQTGNWELEQATGWKTRMIRVENASEETLQSVVDKGFCLSASKLKLSRDTLNTSQQANALFRNVSSTKKDSFLWLGENIQTGGLVTFLSQVKQAQEYCLPLRETTEIF